MMSLNAASMIYACPNSIRWVKDTDQIIVVDAQRSYTHILQGVDAAIWGWLSLRYSYPKVVHLVAALLALPPDEAEQTLLATLRRWHTAGLLEVVG